MPGFRLAFSTLAAALLREAAYLLSTFSTLPVKRFRTVAS
jgi:hypothetical protein